MKAKRFYIANFISEAQTLFSAVPFSISSYALLTYLIAHICDLEVGEFVHTFGDLHIYSNHLEKVEEILIREPLALPKIEFKDAENLKGFEGLLNFKYENLSLQNYQSWGKLPRSLQFKDGVPAFCWRSQN